VQLAFDGRVTLYIADFVLWEIREISNKPTPAKAGVTAKKAEDMVQMLLAKAEFITDIPAVFVHPIDEDDWGHVNLALVAGAKLIVSRDRHLLNLNNPAKP
jgi:predicted nucleic acid-binding protein